MLMSLINLWSKLLDHRVSQNKMSTNFVFEQAFVINSNISVQTVSMSVHLSLVGLLMPIQNIIEKHHAL